LFDVVVNLGNSKMMDADLLNERAGTLGLFEKTIALAKLVNVMVLGTEHSMKHRFVATFLGPAAGKAPGEVPVKKLMIVDTEPFLLQIDTNIDGCWGVSDQAYRNSQGFMFVYNTSSRSSFEAFTTYRERMMRVKEVGGRLPLMIVGYHQDDKGRKVQAMEGKKLSEYFGCLFREVRQDDPLAVHDSIVQLLGEILAFESGYIAKKRGEDAEEDETDLPELGLGVFGDIFSGKTCLIRKLVSNSYHPRYIATEEDNQQILKMSVDKVKCMVRITDTPGLFAGQNFTKEYLIPMQGFILVYSITSRDSFNLISELKSKIMKCKPESKVPFVLVGCKKDDKLARQVRVEEGQNLAKQIGASFFEVSAKEDDSVDDCFAQCVRAIRNVFQTAPVTQVLGQLGKTGLLMKQQKKKWLTRTVTLRDGVISYSKATTDPSISSPAVTKEKWTMHLVPGVSIETSLPHDPKIGYPFDLVSPQQDRWSLAASTEEEKEAWIAAIRLNMSMREVAEGLVNDVLKAMLWEIVSGEDGGSGVASRSTRTWGTRTQRPSVADLLGSPLHAVGEAFLTDDRAIAHSLYYGRIAAEFSPSSPVHIYQPEAGLAARAMTTPRRENAISFYSVSSSSSSASASAASSPSSPSTSFQQPSPSTSASSFPFPTSSTYSSSHPTLVVTTTTSSSSTASSSPSSSSSSQSTNSHSSSSSPSPSPSSSTSSPSALPSTTSVWNRRPSGEHSSHSPGAQMSPFTIGSSAAAASVAAATSASTTTNSTSTSNFHSNSNSNSHSNSSSNHHDDDDECPGTFPIPSSSPSSKSGKDSKKAAKARRKSTGKKEKKKSSKG
jgi:GTPase KRas protein